MKNLLETQAQTTKVLPSLGGINSTSIQNATNSSISVESWLLSFELDDSLASDCSFCMNITDCNYYCSACSIKFKTNNCRKYSITALVGIYTVILLIGISFVFLMVSIVCAFKTRGIKNNKYVRQKEDNLPTYNETIEKKA